MEKKEKRRKKFFKSSLLYTKIKKNGLNVVYVYTRTQNNFFKALNIKKER